MRHLRLFEQFHLNEISLEYIEAIASEADVYGNYDRAIKYVHETINRFLQRIQDRPTVELYRTLKLRDLSELNRDNLGLHYREHESTHDDFFTSIEIEDNLDDDYRIFDLAVEVNVSDIDIDATIAARLNYPTEDEITLKPNSKTRIIDIEDCGAIEDFLHGDD